MSKEAEEWFKSDDRPDFSVQRKAFVFGYDEVMNMMNAYAKHYMIQRLEAMDMDDFIVIAEHLTSVNKAISSRAWGMKLLKDKLLKELK